jgi:ATP-dependent DNA helicase PIF1
MAKIELNEKFKKAFDLLDKTNKNIFIAGKAGTGKTTLIEYFRDKTKKKAVFLAPTGVAAVNVKGQTIHSFFGFGPDITLSRVHKKDEKDDIYKSLETIVIDEVSMVRADLLDCIDKFMRLNGKNKKLPFGGVQMVFIGDLYQLPPVVTRYEQQFFNRLYPTPYFFSAKVFGDNQEQLLSDGREFNIELVELLKIYRQKDKKFIKLLNAVRDNTVSAPDIDEINKRVYPQFETTPDDFYIYLTPTNAAADRVNYDKLEMVKGKEHVYFGEVKGEFDKKAMPTDLELMVKVGAQVMMVKNDPKGRWINGTVGRVIDVIVDKNSEDDFAYGDSLDDEIIIQLEDGKTVSVGPYMWDFYRYFLDEDSGQLDSEVVGTFMQYPFKLAWAVTIHKSQGKTFDKMILDLGRGVFSPGQLYVALSRARTLGGLILKKPVMRNHIWLDDRVKQFMEGL